MFKVVPSIIYAHLHLLQLFVKCLQVLVLWNIFEGLCNLALISIASVSFKLEPVWE